MKGEKHKDGIGVGFVQDLLDFLLLMSSMLAIPQETAMIQLLF